MDAIGKYSIVRQIGLGGFGVVYEGVDPFLKRRVAIKTCTTDEGEIRDRFFREAEIAGNLQHRNIVTVHDFGIQDGVPYLVQEYLTGEDLTRLIARREPLTPERKLEVLLEVAKGLEYAHSRGVIHRDVKPANVRVTENGAVKIMDFGIAKLANVASHLTRTGMTLGTAAYLPPEQIKGQAVDHRADIFSFGVLAFELLAYKRPFEGRTISVLFFEILQRETPSLSEHFPDCPKAVEAMVLRCLAKKPDERYPGFGPVISELTRGLAELRSPPAPPPASAASELPLTERATRKVTSDVVQAAIAKAAEELRASAASSPPEREAEAPRPPQRSSWGPTEAATPVEDRPTQPSDTSRAPSAREPAARPGPAHTPSPPAPRRAAVAYPAPPRPSGSKGLPWPLLGAAGAAFFLLLLAILFVILF